MGLFTMNPQERLKESEIRTHPWFYGIDFAKMQRKQIAPPVDVLVKLQMLAGEDFGKDEEQHVNVELSTGEYVESSERLFQGF
jgi:hypothetical protein